MAGLGILFFITRAQSALIDPDSFCNRNGPTGVTLVLLDASDAIDEVKAERVKSAIVNIARSSERGVRLDIYVADTSDGSLAEPAFSLCNPGAPGSYEALYSNAKKSQTLFEERFLESIELTLAGLLVVEPANASPILESIRSAATASFSRLKDSTPTELVIVSDMVQNTPILRHRVSRQGTEEAAFLQEFNDFQKSSSWPNALADLHDARVHLLYISRSQYRTLQGRSHQFWWEQYFNAVNARLVGIDTI